MRVTPKPEVNQLFVLYKMSQILAEQFCLPATSIAVRLIRADQDVGAPGIPALSKSAGKPIKELLFLVASPVEVSGIDPYNLKFFRLKAEVASFLQLLGGMFSPSLVHEFKIWNPGRIHFVI